MLRGRSGDQAAIDALLAGGRDGRSGAMILRGEPGIGKTALIEYAASQADGMTVIRGVGIETEAEIAFGSLHLLLLPLLDRLDLLPGPQSAALKSAFGLGPTASHDQMLAGLAVLSLLASAADERPLLCLIDDAQWLDQASARALLFASRRVQAEGVVLIFGAREEFDGSGLTQRQLLGLDRPTSVQLLADHTPGLATLVRDRLIEESAGNPLALLELPRSSDSLSYYHSPLPLPRRIQETYERRIARLPPAAQTMLLVAAADPTGDLRTVLDAATGLGVEVSMLGHAERAGFLRVSDAGVSFVHPLMRAAAFQHGTFDQRLAVHAALADALVDQPERRAWQLAAAATGPDERAADALARAAVWARERNGYAATAAALERSAELTADVVLKAERLVDAAIAAADAGLPRRTRSLVERSSRLTTQPKLRSRLSGLRARVAFEEGDPGSAHDLLLTAAADVAEHDRAAAGIMLVDAGRNAWQRSDPDRLLEAASRLRELGLTAEDGLTPAMDAVVAAATFLREGPAGALDVMRGLVTSAREIRTGSTSLRINAAFVAGLTGDFEAGREISLGVADECRSQGAAGWLPLAHITLAAAELYLGRFRDAVATATEGVQISADIGQPNRSGYLEGVLAWVAAVGGDDERCTRYATSCLDRFSANGIASALAWAPWSLALLDLGRGRLPEALGRLEEAVRGPVRHQIQAVYFAPDQVETAVRLGQPDRAAEPLARFQAWADASTLDWSSAVLYRCRALLEPDADAAHELYRHALRSHAVSGRPWETARTYLAFGERLRRDRRIADARDPLRHALEIFERLAATPWAHRARAELRAAGESSTMDKPSDLLAALSPQELQIVRLAASGLTNPEIGAQLFLSAKTISYHLYRAFPKLNVTSRTQLARLDLRG